MPGFTEKISVADEKRRNEPISNIEVHDLPETISSLIRREIPLGKFFDTYREDHSEMVHMEVDIRLNVARFLNVEIEATKENFEHAFNEKFAEMLKKNNLSKPQTLTGLNVKLQITGEDNDKKYARNKITTKII